MTTLSDILIKSRQDIPDQVAIYLQHAGHEDFSITYEGLFRNAAGYSRVFESQGIQPGEVVVLILQHGKELIFSFFGAILHGAVPSIMPFLTEKLSPERYRADMAALIGVTRPAGIVTYPEFEEEVRAALEEGDSVRRVILAEEIDPVDIGDANMLSGLRREEDDIVLLQHSSGTTGLQKGVALSHQAIVNQLDAYGQALHLSKDDVLVSWLPLYHDMGLIAGFLLPVLNRIPLVLLSPFDWVRAPYRLMQSVSQYRGTLSWMPNFAYNFCAQRVRERDMEDVDLSSWRMIVNCSEPVRWESHEAFYEKFKKYGLEKSALHTSYAMAENVFGVTQSDPRGAPVVEIIDREAFLGDQVARHADDELTGLKLMSSGRVISNTNIRVVDEARQDLPDGNIGEIILKSDCMLSGYYNRPGITEKAFSDDWYLTGDYGYLSNGELFVTGRKKDMLIVGGKNVYPQDIEEIAYEVDGVHKGRAVVFGIFDERSGTEDVVLVAEADLKDDAERQKISDALRQHVTKNAAIALRYVRVVGPKWILKSSSGKTARLANKEKYLKEVFEK
ncbi:MAG: AMP-binding protein [Anaerolineales bacterium]|uniref:AMP-binding protein n=1 Tax=Candidatus Desulfolinea nitratireducens TaxID=2841698 RepID=A0A8J6NM27_9CHLR|nr:AMP-binding protein [Candidatus Desulfolinea nitratireducens]MBL6959739.1 AMP-binding protein [Anaerolineales bacterium]